MIVISDNDVLRKLACCDLYDEFLEAFDVSYQDVWVLNTARHVLGSKRARKRLDEAGFQRLSKFLDAIRIIDIAPDPDEQLALAEQPNIDTGEAVLFSVTHQMSDAILATGDKRSLQSLAEATDMVCRRLCQRLAGKVICFEQILWKILDYKGFDAIRDKLLLGRECDKALAIVLGSGLNATEQTLREGLESYINALRKQTDALLVP